MPKYIYIPCVVFILGIQFLTLLLDVSVELLDAGSNAQPLVTNSYKRTHNSNTHSLISLHDTYICYINEDWTEDLTLCNSFYFLPTKVFTITYEQICSLQSHLVVSGGRPPPVE